MRKLQLLLLVIGLAALTWTVIAVGPGRLADGVVAIGWGLILTSGAHFTGLSLDAVTLRATAGAAGRQVPYRHYLRTSLAGHAINEATPFGKAGELTKYALLSERMPGERAAAALVAQNIVMFVVNCGLIAAGAPLALVVFDVVPGARPAFALTGAAFAVAGAVAVVLLHRGVGSWPLSLARRLGVPRWRLGRRRIGAERLDRWQTTWSEVQDIWREAARDRRAQAVAWVSAVASRSANLVETGLILHFLGGRQLAAAAVVSLASSQLVGWLFSFMPMGAGTAEGGSYVVFRAVGLSPALGVLVEIGRRLRRLVFIGVGVAVLGQSEFRHARRGPRSRRRGYRPAT